jgi:glycosyltransferase involved in cell wall biosynthesis
MNRYAVPISERVRVSQSAPDWELDVRSGVAPRILTDVEIHQDSLWSEATTLVRRVDSPVLDSLGGWLRRNTEGTSDVFTALKLLVRQGDYDAVVTSGLRTSQIFGFLRTLLRMRQPPHIHLELMLDEEKSSLSWKLKRAFQRLALASTDLLITSSGREIDIYSDRLKFSPERFRFVLFHTNVVNPGVVGKERGYAFSAGRSGRDYQALASAVAGLDLDLVVLGDAASLRDVNFPDRTQVLVDQPYERYLELLHGCDFVIVPLNAVKIARGQVVILEAMAVGKPVIATETVGTEDYIEPGVNGFLVPPGDVPALRDAIRRLHEDAQLRERLRQRGLKDIERHTFRAYVESVLGHVEQVIAERR